MRMPKIVFVEWEDACCLDSGTWVDSDIETMYEPVIMRTVGFLLLDKPEGVIVTGTFSPVSIAPRDQIPRGMIRKFIVLQEEGKVDIEYPEKVEKLQKTSKKTTRKTPQ